MKNLMLPKALRELSYAVSRYNQLAELHLEKQEHNPQSVTRYPARKLLGLLRNRDSSDNRDRIYSIVGMIDPGYRIEPNYQPTNSVQATFISATISVIHFDRALDIISDAGEDNTIRGDNLPTWVPEFRVEQLLVDKLESCKKYSGDYYKAGSMPIGFNLYPSIEQNVRFLPNERCQSDRILQCKVLHLGHVAEAATIGPPVSKAGRTPILRLNLVANQVWFRSILERAGLLESFLERRDQYTLHDPWVTIWTTGRCRTPLQNDSPRELVALYAAMRFMFELISGRNKFFITPGPEKLLGVAIGPAKHTDQLCIAFGCDVPWILRLVPGKSNRFTFVCGAYVHEAMYGELIEKKINENGFQSLKTIQIE